MNRYHVYMTADGKISFVELLQHQVGESSDSIFQSIQSNHSTNHQLFTLLRMEYLSSKPIYLYFQIPELARLVHFILTGQTPHQAKQQ